MWWDEAGSNETQDENRDNANGAAPQPPNGLGFRNDMEVMTP